jgi:hypothetical protein
MFGTFFSFLIYFDIIEQGKKTAEKVALRGSQSFVGHKSQRALLFFFILPNINKKYILNLMSINT